MSDILYCADMDVDQLLALEIPMFFSGTDSSGTLQEEFIMKSAMTDKRVYFAFGIALVLVHTLLLNNICAQTYGAQYISYVSNSTGDYNIYLQDTNGENLRLLTNHPADEKDLTWSPDGRFMAYTSNQDGTYKIYVLDTRTGEHWRLTDRDEREWTPAWSPDGKWIAFVSGNLEFIPGVKINITTHIYKADINGAHLVQRMVFGFLRFASLYGRLMGNGLPMFMKTHLAMLIFML